MATVALHSGGAASKAGAAEEEIRTFSVKIDGRPAGSYRMQISRPDDHTFVMDGRADVSVSRLLLKVYSYSYRGREVWKDGRLFRLESKTNEDGKQLDVVAWAEGEQLRIRANGKDRTIRPDVWTMTYWRLPEPQFRTQAVTLLDCDTGKDLQGSMRTIGVQQLTVAGQTHNCTHYQVQGGVTVDLWYDAQQRLVRQESLDDGHRVVLELMRIER